MKKHLILLLTATLFLVLGGCDKELNDENFADFWLEADSLWGDDAVTIVGLRLKVLNTVGETANAMAREKILESYGWSDYELNAYLKSLIKDQERVGELYNLLETKDKQAAASFIGMAAGLYANPDVME
jgi:hypothetical protein